MAGCAVAFPEAGSFFERRLGGDDRWGQREVDLVGLKAAVAGAVVKATRWWRGCRLGGHLRAVLDVICGSIWGLVGSNLRSVRPNSVSEGGEVAATYLSWLQAINIVRQTD